MVDLSSEELVKYNGMTSEKRREQWLAVRALLPLMAGKRSRPIGYDDLGKPHLHPSEERISVTHSGKMVAIQLSAQKQYCGIDIQEYSEKIDRLAHKFVHPGEAKFIAANREKEYLNLIWTMKEAVFKHFGTEVEFKSQIRIEAFDLHRDQLGVARVERNGKTHTIQLAWRRIDQYFLSYLC